MLTNKNWCPDLNEKAVRIIPRIDVKNENLVKGIQMEGIRILGKPEWFARIYYEAGADEIIFYDVVASLYGRNSMSAIIENTANSVFIPITVTGGIRTIDDIRNILKVGADKVAINTAAVENPAFLKEAVMEFGSQCIIASIEASETSKDFYEVLTNCGRERTGKNAIDWISEVQDLGVGEILLTSVEREGTGKGFDKKLIKKAMEMINIPVLVAGGAGSKEDVAEIIDISSPDGVVIASIFHYDIIQNSRNYAEISNSFGPDINIDFILNKELNTFYKNNLKTVSLMELKKYLSDCNISCRI